MCSRAGSAAGNPPAAQMRSAKRALPMPLPIRRTERRASPRMAT